MSVVEPGAQVEYEGRSYIVVKVEVTHSAAGRSINIAAWDTMLVTQKRMEQEERAGLQRATRQALNEAME